MADEDVRRRERDARAVGSVEEQLAARREALRGGAPFWTGWDYARSPEGLVERRAPRSGHYRLSVLVPGPGYYRIALIVNDCLILGETSLAVEGKELERFDYLDGRTVPGKLRKRHDGRPGGPGMQDFAVTWSLPVLGRYVVKVEFRAQWDREGAAALAVYELYGPETPEAKPDPAASAVDVGESMAAFRRLLAAPPHASLGGPG